MSHYEGHNAELQAKELGACLREAAQRDISVEHLALEAERLRRAVTQTTNAKRPLRDTRRHVARLLAAAAILVMVAAGVWGRQKLHGAPLAFEVVGPGRLSPSYVVTPETSSALLNFTDGSTVEAAPATRLRVPELRLDGATVMLERGQATVQVRHRNAATRWNIVAGPFNIAVTGTRFVVAWSPATERLSLDMFEGSIEVDGPKFTAPATLRGGQHLEAKTNDAAWAVTPLLEASAKDAQARETQASPLGEPGLASADVAVRPSQGTLEGALVRSVPAERRAKAAAPSASPSASSAPNVASPETRSWTKMVARGESQRVVAEAEATGLKNCLGQCSSSDLRALADAARYSGRLDLAEAALRALRDREPGQAAVATYLLGAVDEARGRNSSALRWYEEYIAMTPNGGFASEAFAGRLRMLVATNGYTSARKAALQYLELYPSGVGARTAKQVLERR